MPKIEFMYKIYSLPDPIFIDCKDINIPSLLEKVKAAKTEKVRLSIVSAFAQEPKIRGFSLSWVPYYNHEMMSLGQPKGMSFNVEYNRRGGTFYFADDNATIVTHKKYLSELKQKASKSDDLSTLCALEKRAAVSINDGPRDNSFVLKTESFDSLIGPSTGVVLRSNSKLVLLVPSESRKDQRPRWREGYQEKMLKL